MTAVGGTKKQTNGYDKPEQFREFMDGLMGTGRQFYIPHRYIMMLRGMVEQNPTAMARNPRQFLTDCLYELGIDYEYNKKIPNVYFTVTGDPILHISEDDMPWIEHVYQKINDVKIRKYPDKSIPNGKYMLRRILLLLDIPFESHKIGSIKETKRLWHMDRRWNKFLKHIDITAVLHERARQALNV